MAARVAAASLEVARSAVEAKAAALREEAMEEGGGQEAVWKGLVAKEEAAMVRAPL